jgi:asparagine synthase (glutamine-hydrolysing)
MCGIAGIVRGDYRIRVDPTQVRKMCAAIVYRGPDDEGIYTNGPVGLGMRRLSIIDVAGGQQPICNEDRTVWVVFNGEIYNFQLLRKELEQLGHVFHTHSDTEVIVHAYEQFGSECVKRLRGMFAFALYDFRKNKLLLARDRFGKKPLHYALKDGVLYFGSEIKSLFAVAPDLATIDQEALSQFFYYGYVPDPFTAFRTVRKLPPAHYLEFEGNSVQLREYWDLPQFCSTTLPEEQCLEEMEATLESAVRMRLISEVPLGALLSGGVDSSTVVAMMARLSGRPVKTFTIGFTHADFDEAVYARSVAERFNTDHHELLVEADLWGTLEELTGILDEPFADSSVIPTYHVARMARKYVTVALSGDGGDELFAGYDSYLVHYRRRHLDLLPSWIAPAYHRLVYPHLPARVRSRKLAYNFVLNARDRFVNSRAVIQSYDEELSILSPEFLQSISGSEPAADTARKYYDHAPAKDTVSRMQYTDIKTYLTADVLTKVDRMSMACSLEIRSPLLDHVFAEQAVSLPLNLKIRNGNGKYLLRRLAEKLGVPARALNRPKQGFSLPLTHWMRSELRAEITSILLEARTLQRGYFRRSAVEKLLREHHRGDRDHSAGLWQLLVFELWHRNYMERTSRAASVTVGAMQP